jgi:CHAT domain-containing protein/tetratricopeptide (TPR) repeat protein
MRSRRWDRAAFVFGTLLLAIVASTVSVWAQPADVPAVLSRKITDLQTAGKYLEALPLAQRLVTLTKARHGANSSEHAAALEQLAATYFVQSRYADAEPIYREVIAIREKAFGPEHQSVLSVLDTLASIYRFSNRPELAEPILKRILSSRERVAGPDHPSVGVALRNLAEIEIVLQQYEPAGDHLRRALALAETQKQSRVDIAKLLSTRAKIELGQGLIAEAERTLKQALVLHESAARASRDDPNVALAQMFTLVQLAGLYQQSDRASEAAGVSEQVLTMIEKVLGPDHPNVATQLEAVASAYGLLGRYADAEPLRKRAIAINERALGREHPSVALSLQGLGHLYRLQGRNDEAQPLLVRGLAIAEKSYGPDHPALTVYLAELAGLYRTQRRNAEVEPLLRRVLANLEKAQGIDPVLVGVQMINALDGLGLLNLSMGRHAEALPYFERALAVSERVFGPDHSMTGGMLRSLGMQFLDQGRIDEAERFFERALPMAEKAGHNDVGTADTIAGLAMVHFKRENWARAYTEMTRASAIYLMLDKRATGTSATRNTGNTSIPHAEMYLMQAVTAFSLAEVQPSLADSLRDEAFILVQRAQSSQAGGALNQMAARFSAGGGALGALVRERQDLGAEWLALDTQLTSELSAAASQRSAPREQLLRKRLAVIVDRLDRLDTRLTTAFPDYATLASPRPLGLAEAQRYLAPDEALVVIASRLNQSLVWVISKDDARWSLVPLGEQELAREVAALRCGLDATAWTGSGGSDCNPLLSVAFSPDRPPPFDLARSHALYETLLGPFGNRLSGKHLLIAASGPLAALPFSVLVTETPPSGLPSDAAGYADAAWLVKRHPISVLPAVSSLAALRAVTLPSMARHPFIGFGNPLLGGADGKDRSAWATQTCAPATMKRPDRVAARSGPSDLGKLFRGARANVETLRQQSPLPETADELCSVARELGAESSDVVLGARATEHAVKALSAQGRLADYRVVHFATHGLLSGEALSLGLGAEPALLLTPPDVASDDDDGLLAASEVAKLKLDADWVVLSACNTASAAKAGAQPLSGLTRAFFYAGARALLVSHWYVESDAAVRLMAGAFAAAHRDPTAGRAEVVRRAMLSVMADQSRGAVWSLAHPSAWAPFVVVGEGGAGR